MVRFERDGRAYVLRRGPEHLRPRCNDVDPARDRVLARLAGTPSPARPPDRRLRGRAVLGGAVFYLMEPIDGFNASVELPALHARGRRRTAEMAFAIVDALADPRRGRPRGGRARRLRQPDGFLERQVPRWLSRARVVRDATAITARASPACDEVADWLEAHRPQALAPGIMHGDFHAANVMFARTGPEVAAIVDWEMCTIGDPLLDLGWLLATWQLPRAPKVCSPDLALHGDLPGAAASWSSATPSAPSRDLAAIAGTPCSPASSSASCSRARTPAPTPARRRWRSASSSTPPPCASSSAPRPDRLTRQLRDETEPMIDFEIPADRGAARRDPHLRRPSRSCPLRDGPAAHPARADRGAARRARRAGPRGRAADLPGAARFGGIASRRTSTRRCSTRRPAGRRSARSR